MRYCSIHRLDYVAQCDACAASRDRKNRFKWQSDPSNPVFDQSIINTMVEAQRLADAVVDAAIDWHKSDMEESMDAAQTLEDAIEALLEFRRKMPIVKDR